MQIHLKADIQGHILSELKSLGIEPASNDLTECALLLFKIERRYPEVRPRQTKIAVNFSVPDELRIGFERLLHAIHSGDDLKPYLSRETFNIDKSDKLLDDWGILHLHMGEKIQANGLIQGTKIVAFALVRNDCVYFIEALPHGHGHGDVWFQENLIHVIDKNWPYLLPTNRTLISASIISPQERKVFRKKHVNVTVTKPTGEVIFPPGGGFMADGTSMADHIRLQHLYADLDYLEKLYRQHEVQIRTSLSTCDKDLALYGRIVDGKIKVYEMGSNIEVRLNIEPTYASPPVKNIANE